MSSADDLLRRWSKRRGRMALQFLCDTAPNSLGHSMRELARGCWLAGYDTYVQLADTDSNPQPSWARTSVRHLHGEARAPKAMVSWGVGWRNPGEATVEFEVADSFSWSQPTKTAGVNECVDLLCVPAECNVAEIRRGGVEVPIAVVPLGVDVNRYRPAPASFDPADELAKVEWIGRRPSGRRPFVFLMAGYMQHRKGVEVALQAYRRAFRPDDPVALVVKSVASHWGTSQRQALVEAAGGAPVGLYEQVVSEREMVRLLWAADCYLSPHHREGFGLMPLQAMACGVVPLVTNYDGPASYCDATNSILVEPSRVGTAPELPGVPPSAEWAYLDVDALADVMRATFDAGRRDDLIDGALRTASRMTWRHSAERLVERLAEHVGLARRVPPPPDVAPGLSILVPCRNGAADLQAMVSSLEKNPPTSRRWEVVVYDDGSSPAIDLFDPPRNLRVVRESDSAIGEGAARAVLLDEARYGNVLVCDADVVFKQHGWEDPLKALVDHRTVVHPLVLDPRGRVWSAGGCYHDYGDPEGVLPAWHRHGGDKVADVTTPDELCYAPTVAWYARLEPLRALLKDWSFGYYPTIFADVDMAFWLRAHGVRFVLAKESRIVHNHGSYTVKQTSPEDQAERFAAHAAAFRWWWREMMDDDLARGLGVEGE